MRAADMGSSREMIEPVDGTSFSRVGAFLAAFVGVGGLVYGILFALILKGTSTNVLRAWLVLAILGGLAVTGVFVALFERLRLTDPPLAMWALLLGVAAGLGQMLNASVALGYQIYVTPPPGTFEGTPDPVGILRFGLNGVALFLFGSVMVRARDFPRALGLLADAGGLLLVVMYVGRLAGFINPATKVTLIPPFLYGFVIHPVFYVWMARHLLRPQA